MGTMTVIDGIFAAALVASVAFTIIAIDWHQRYQDWVKHEDYYRGRKL